jgi:Flp pilus assembly protein TadG
LTDESGATAAMFALSLFALVGIAGVGFDYARLAGMDSELQNAADQAALAAASQLDGRAGACGRASAAASGLVQNWSLLANDGAGPTVTIASETSCDAVGAIRFYRDKAKTQVASTDANARFVEIRVGARVANYTFTPIVGALNSGAIDAAAFAGLGSAVCKVPPVMMCNPAESTDANFTVANYIGSGIRLVANDGGGGYGPGNFGFLDNNAGNGATAVRQVLGNLAPPGDCVASTGVTTQPGEMVSVLDALNTRFDIYANGLTSVCGNNNLGCPPSANTRKDVVKDNGGGGGPGGGGGGGGGGPGGGGGGGGGATPSCAFVTGTGGNGWRVPSAPYLPSSATTPLTSEQAAALSPMGYPRDMCHAVSNSGSCAGGRVGDGIWDRMAYFRTNSTNYPTLPSSGDMISWFGSETPSRYAVYRYEMANPGSRLQNQSAGGGTTAHGAPVCGGSGSVPSSTTPDRRLFTVAVINCQAAGVTGRTTNIEVIKWIDVFLVEPSLPRARTEQSDVYVEVVREARLGEGAATTNNTVRRDIPYLIE